MATASYSLLTLAVDATTPAELGPLAGRTYYLPPELFGLLSTNPNIVSQLSGSNIWGFRSGNTFMLRAAPESSFLDTAAQTGKKGDLQAVIDQLTANGFTTQQAIDMIERILASGKRVNER